MWVAKECNSTVCREKAKNVGLTIKPLAQPTRSHTYFRNLMAVREKVMLIIIVAIIKVSYQYHLILY